MGLERTFQVLSPSFDEEGRFRPSPFKRDVPAAASAAAVAFSRACAVQDKPAHSHWQACRVVTVGLRSRNGPGPGPARHLAREPEVPGDLDRRR
jgi:hypothetical protein